MPEVRMSREERIGYHKGAISTLVGERNELIRLLKIADELIKAHAKELEKFGIKIPLGEKRK